MSNNSPFFNASYHDSIRGSFLLSDDGALRVDARTGYTYIGYSVPGAGESENLWKIKKITESGTITTMLYPLNEWGIPDKDFNYRWTDRASYIYLANVGSLSYPPKEIYVYEYQTNYSIPETRAIKADSKVLLKIAGGRVGSGASWTWYDEPTLTTPIGYGEEFITTVSQTTTFYCRYTGGLNNTSLSVKRTVHIL